MLLVVGRIVRPHGIRGDLTCEVRTDEPDERFGAGSVLVTDPASHGPLTVAYARWHQGRLLLGFENIADRDTAETLRGVLLCVDSEQLSQPDDPETFRDQELVGLTVKNEDGDVLGTVGRIEHNAAHDTIVMQRPEGGKPALIPFVHALVPTVDVAAGHVLVRLPEGLLDL